MRLCRAEVAAAAVLRALVDERDGGEERAVAVEVGHVFRRAHLQVDIADKAYLIKTRHGLEEFLDVAHIRRAARYDEAADERLLRVFGERNLVVDVHHNLLLACLYQSAELFKLHAAAVVQLNGCGLRFVFVVRNRRAVHQFEFLRLVVFDLERHDVAVDVCAAEGNGGQMAQEVVLVDGDGGRFCAHVYKDAARAALRLREHRVGKCLHGDGEVGNGHVRAVEAVADFFLDRRVCHDVEVASLDALREHAHGFVLQLRAELELLRYGFENVAVGRCAGTVLVADGINHLLRHLHFRAEVAHNGVSHGVHAHAADAHIDAADVLLEFLLQALLDVEDALRHLVDVVDAPLANKGCGRLLRQCQHLDAAVGFFFSGDGRHF